MDACRVWFEDAHLLAADFIITTGPDGRRTATRGDLTYLLDGPCQHLPEQCPPHRTEQRAGVAA